MIEFLLDIPLNNKVNGLSELFLKKPLTGFNYSDKLCEFIAWGDPILTGDIRRSLAGEFSADKIINNMYGHYYYIHLDKTTFKITIGNSMFSILPVYYCTTETKIILSDNAISLGKHTEMTKINKRFILETILFNYPLFNDSFYSGIRLLQSNSSILVSGTEITIQKHTNIENLFYKKPVFWHKSSSDLTDKFLETVEKYLPCKRYVSSITGGFDGRTLVASGMYYNKDFSLYCFGTSISKDIKIAEILSKAVKRPLMKILLEEDYARQKSLINGKEFIQNCSGSGTFARAHYLHAAKCLSENNEHIITGNFGSEIFRAAHNVGVVISKNLYTLFGSASADNAFTIIKKSNEFSSLNGISFIEEWDSLKEDMVQLPCFNSEYSGFTANQRFYILVFEEIFRKYFGAEIVNQFKYIKNRTPFLDIDFIMALLKTKYAGIYSDFFVHNPLKRYKGQVLYAKIIREAYPALGKIMTDKGYKPDDLINLSGKARIINGFIQKISQKRITDKDPYGVREAWRTNQDFWNKIPISRDYFKIQSPGDIRKDILYRIISLSLLINDA